MGSCMPLLWTVTHRRACPVLSCPVLCLTGSGKRKVFLPSKSAQQSSSAETRYSYSPQLFFVPSLRRSFSLSLSSSSSFFLHTHLTMSLIQQLDFKPETPFGVPLYPYFEKAYETVTGQPASAFEFTAGVTPLSTVQEGNISHPLHQTARHASACLQVARSLTQMMLFHSGHHLCHLLCCHLRWPVPDEELSRPALPGSVPAS